MVIMNPSTIFIPLFVILGWGCGSLVNYLADVLPWRRKLTAPFCTECEQAMPWRNYLLWPRRCISCRHRRSWRTWLVEVLYIAAAVWLAVSPPERLGPWLGMLVLVFFGVVVVIDIEHRLILHPVSIAGAVLGLGIGTYMNGIYAQGFTLEGVSKGVTASLIGGVFGYGVMWVFYMLGEWLFKMVTRRRGGDPDDVALGFGDVNLSGVLGLMLGWPGILIGLVLGVFLGGAISLVYLLVMLALRRYKLFTAVPYGPFLIAGAFMMIYFREAVVQFLSGG